MTTLRSIVYVSTASRELTERELADLLVDARALNLETGTTGVLLYGGGNFMQCFEGQEAGVQLTYERIRQSRRHHGIIELINEPVAAREFPDWQMGYRRVENSDILAMSTARWQHLQDQAAPVAGGGHGMSLLKHFWLQTER